MEQEKETKNGKRKVFQKKRIRSNMAKICDFISSGFFQRRKKREDVGIHEDAPIGYCGLT